MNTTNTSNHEHSHGTVCRVCRILQRDMFFVMERWKRHCIQNHMMTVSTENVEVNLNRSPRSPVLLVHGSYSRPDTDMHNHTEQNTKRSRQDQPVDESNLWEQSNSNNDSWGNDQYEQIIDHGDADTPKQVSDHTEGDEQPRHSTHMNMTKETWSACVCPYRYCCHCGHDSYEGAQCTCVGLDELSEDEGIYCHTCGRIAIKCICHQFPDELANLRAEFNIN